VLTATFLGLALTSGAWAQSQTQTQAPRGGEQQRQAWTPGANAVEASKLMGMKVRSAGKDVGEINQLVVDPSSGKISHVIVGKGGVLGVGEQRLAVAWDDVKIQQDPQNRDRWVAMVEQADLDKAPRYETRRNGSPAASPATGTSPGSTTQPRQEKKY
jgi:sporulation protein YlmC with PRC-barrel domain